MRVNLNWVWSMAGEFAACHILVCYFEDKCNPRLKTDFLVGVVRALM